MKYIINITRAINHKTCEKIQRVQIFKNCSQHEINASQKGFV